jgi:hypothetical protein
MIMQVTDEMVDAAMDLVLCEYSAFISPKAMRAAIEVAIQAAWQTMETAPTDGTCILFVNKLQEYGICWWGRGEYDLITKGFSYGWRSDSCEGFGGFEEPTHWTELPKYKGE